MQDIKAINTQALGDILSFTMQCGTNRSLERLCRDTQFGTRHCDLSGEVQMALLEASANIKDVREMVVETLGYGSTNYMCACCYDLDDEG